MNLPEYLKSLEEEDWQVMATESWTVKDVVAHLIGWEKECVECFDEVIKTGKQPWFMETGDFDDFNQKNVEFYKNYSPEELIAEWQSWKNKLGEKIENFGRDKVRKDKNLNHLFNEGISKHCAHHLKQIQTALKTI